MLRLLLHSLVLTALLPGAAFAQTPPSTLPGGATSLRETFEDWQVACVAQAGARRCALSQEHLNQNRQRVLAIELIPAGSSTLTGTLVMPFGLLFEPGVTLHLDDKPLGKPLRMRTCLPIGCIVPVQFDGTTVNALRVGAVLKLIAMPSEGSTPVTFSISLKGLAAGLNRTAALAK